MLASATPAAAEAAEFGVPAFFLSEEARGQFSDLIERRAATVIDIEAINSEIARIPAVPVRPKRVCQPAIDETLLYLEDLAREYSQLCRSIG